TASAVPPAQWRRRGGIGHERAWPAAALGAGRRAGAGFLRDGRQHPGQPAQLRVGLCRCHLWAAYCTVTARIAGGKNGITLFFMLTALVLWGKYLLTGGVPWTSAPSRRSTWRPPRQDRVQMPNLRV